MFGLCFWRRWRAAGLATLNLCRPRSITPRGVVQSASHGPEPLDTPEPEEVREQLGQALADVVGTVLEHRALRLRTRVGSEPPTGEPHKKRRPALEGGEGGAFEEEEMLSDSTPHPTSQS